MNDAITYEIRSVQIDGTRATASIFITAPNLYAILTDVASHLHYDADIEELFAGIRVTLDSDYEIFEDIVDVWLERMDNHWFLIPNAELSNALSGNLIKGYIRIVDEIVDDLIGGNFDE